MKLFNLISLITAILLIVLILIMFISLLIKGFYSISFIVLFMIPIALMMGMEALNDLRESNN